MKPGEEIYCPDIDSAVDALADNGPWKETAYAPETTTIRIGFILLTLKPDGTYFLTDDSG